MDDGSISEYKVCLHRVKSPAWFSQFPHRPLPTSSWYLLVILPECHWPHFCPTCSRQSTCTNEKSSCEKSKKGSRHPGAGMLTTHGGIDHSGVHCHESFPSRFHSPSSMFTRSSSPSSPSTLLLGRVY